MNSQTIRRINNEMKMMMSDPPENCSAYIYDDDISQIKATIIGPRDTPYQDGIFSLDIKIPTKYPILPPKVSFETKIYHPNIDSQGNICLSILNKEWSPALTISKILLSISSLLDKPNPNDPLEPEIGNKYKNNKKGFEEIARIWTLEYAK